MFTLLPVVYSAPAPTTTTVATESTQSGDSTPTGTNAHNEFEFGLMELVWQGEFQKLFLSQYLPYGHQWYLLPISGPPQEYSALITPANVPVQSLQWRTYRDSAKVRFSCDQCGNGWTSMKGRVIFWISLIPEKNMGYVLFKLYGQQCKRCQNGQFEHAMWYPDEVVKVINNLFQRVGQIYYGFYRPPIIVVRRPGKPKEPHNAELCQACKDGLCTEELLFN